MAQQPVAAVAAENERPSKAVERQLAGQRARRPADPLLSLVVPVFNEEEAVDIFVEAVTRVLDAASLRFEIVFVNDGSRDDTLVHLLDCGERDKRLRTVNLSRNFGKEAALTAGIDNARGDVLVPMDIDLQDPPELIEKFIPLWEQGWKAVAGVKNESAESPLFFLVRKIYYKTVAGLADVDLLLNFTGFGLYDRALIEHLRASEDPYPYLRGQISEIGYPVARVPFVQPRRARGFTKNNFYTLFDIAMLGFTNHTKVPLRLATMVGFLMALFCFGVSAGYFVYKLLNWDSFTLGTAPVVVGMFFIGSVQLFFIGVLGEYIGAVHTKVTKRPLVVERERLNF